MSCCFFSLVVCRGSVRAVCATVRAKVPYKRETELYRRFPEECYEKQLYVCQQTIYMCGEVGTFISIAKMQITNAKRFV